MNEPSTAAYVAHVSYVSPEDVIAALQNYDFGDNIDPDAIPDHIGFWLREWFDGDMQRLMHYELPDDDLCRCAAGMGGREHRRGKGCT